MMKKIIYVLRSNPEELPPVIAQLFALDSLKYEIHLLITESSNSLRTLFKNTNITIEAVSTETIRFRSFFSKLKINLKYYLLVKKELKNQADSDIWVGSADTAYYLKPLLNKQRLLCINIYELYDKFPKIIKRISSIVKQCSHVVVPEYNRAYILKSWFALEKTPVIIPNKPLYDENININDGNQFNQDQLAKLAGKKIILYQGWISKDRDISKIAEAVVNLNKRNNKFVFVMMGACIDGSIDKIIKDDAVLHMDYVKPPYHLFITQQAYIGIAIYDDSCLNNVFCAPNKIFEYSKYGVPMLCRDIPGLKTTIDSSGAGICLNTDVESEVEKAIIKLDEEHDFYMKNSFDFYETVDVQNAIKTMLSQ